MNHENTESVGAQHAAPMKALSMRQPWAWLVIMGLKTIETRTWLTKYRGPLLIHASGSYGRKEDLAFKQILQSNHLSRELNSTIIETAVRERGFRYTGGIIGKVDLVACVPFTDDSWCRGADNHLVPLGGGCEGRYAWHLEDIVKFKTPISCKGMLGLWTPPDDVLVQIKETA